MSECYSELFIKNSEILKKVEFKDEDIIDGTSLYEVIRIIDGIPLFLERHLERLKNSAKLANLNLWLDINDVKDNLKKLINVNSSINGNIKIVFNYKGENKNIHNFYTYFLMHKYPDVKQYEEGVPAVLCYMERKNPNAKIINISLRAKADKLMQETGAYEAILVDNKNNVTEGSKSNIFMVKDSTVYTAPVEAVLPGITRTIITEICKENNIQLEEKEVSVNDLKEMDALFLSGTSPKVLPIMGIEEKLYNSSTNTIVKNIMVAYNKIIEDYIKVNK